MARRPAAPDPQQLALFEAPAPVEPVVSVVVAEVAELAPPSLSDLPVVPFEPVSIASVLTPAIFRHPQADREIRLDDHVDRKSVV